MKKWWQWFIMSGMWILITLCNVLDNRNRIVIGFDITAIILFAILGIMQKR